jgi:hypothetical protein
MSEPMSPLVRTPQQHTDGLLEAMQRASRDLPEMHDNGVKVSALWVQGDGVSLAIQVKVTDRITGRVVATKTYDDLRVFAELGIRF